MKKNIYTYLFLGFFFVAFNSSAQLFINEYSCANKSQFADNNTKYEDWIEIYNDGFSTVSLQDYYLSDDITDQFKYKIPSGISITSKGYVRFWASGRNMVSGSHYHTNFHLTQSKTNADWVVLSDVNGNIVDKVQITRHQLGHSVGRKPNGGSTWGIFTSPTINASNTATQYPRYAEKPIASAPAGYYSATFTLYLSTTEPNSKIYYTTDGKVPTISSKLYSAPLGIKIDSTKVIKAITVSNNASVLKSFAEINTYFYKVNHTLPVISIAGTNLDVLANGDNTQRPEGSFEFFNKDKKRTATSYGSFNSHGQDSWANDQRSLDYKTHDEMGYNYAIQEQLFSLSDRSEFQGIILRAAGDDNYPAAHHASNDGSAHIRDAYVQNLAKQGNLKVDLRTAEKAIIYLNGKYWGVYDMRERADEHDYTKYYYNQDKYNIQYILTWGTTWAEYGGGQAINDWSNLRSFVMNKNMAIDSNFKYVTDRLDVYSLVDYVIVNSVSVCSDWLNYNTGWWRGLNKKGGHQKWGYTLWDNDATFGFYINYTGIPDTGSSAPVCNVENSGLSDPEGHIDLLLKLCQNKAFNQYYKSRYIDLANTVFSSKNMLSKLDSTINLLKPEMAMHAKRWFGTYNEWMTNANKLRNFVAKRCSLMNNGINTCYGFSGPYKTTFQVFPKGSADIQINSLRIDSFPFTGNYHGKVDVLIKAIPHKDYLFDYWVVRKDTIKPDTMTWDAVLRVAGVDTIYSYFKKRTDMAQLNISEINYDNDVTRNSGTWFELTNYGNTDIDISHWTIQSGVKWKQLELPANSVIAAHSKWLFVSDSLKFHSLYGAKNNVVYMNFDLVANNEAIYLYDTINTLILYVPFKTKQPWPLAANKAGRTLELLNDTLDAANPLSWRNGCIGGSPGEAYTTCNELIQVAEINYNSYPAANAGDWFELYNHHTDTVDLTGYTIRTDKFYHAYPIIGSLKIAPGKRMVICEDTASFFKVYPNLTNVFMLNGLKLSNAGDQIKLYNANDSILYSVAYEDTLMFTQKADGLGYTLDYNYKGDDHSDGRNWSATCFGGSPGDSTGSCESGILFTEINYKSAPFNDAGDWFEIKNTSNTDYNINGWNFSDSSAGGFTINQNYILKANSYLVMVSDTSKFKSQYPNVTNYMGNLNFNLSSGGDKIRIFNASNKLINIFSYKDTIPWPKLVNGTGFTLELKDTSKDLNNGSNWFRGCLGGSPGVAYTACDDSIVVSEINYSSNNKADVGDWIEILNKSKSARDLSSWTFHDDNIKDTFILANNTILQAGERLVLYNDSAKFKTFFPNVSNAQGPFNFGLSSATDQIKLRDNNSRLRFGMTYNSDSSWELTAKGGAYTLNLVRDSIIYSESRFWKAECPLGSPGTIGGACFDQVAISEINFNSHPKLNSEDWIEFTNESQIPVNITGYKLYNGDSTKSFVIPNAPLIYKGDYLVIVSDSVKFKLAHPNTPFVGNMTFNLKNTGDGVKLYSNNKNRSAWASFDTAAGWPKKAIGGGYTLERTHYAISPNQASAWFAGCLGGSPHEPYQACINNLVISEINYRPAATFDAGKWIELHNRSNTDTIQLSGMSIGNKTSIGDYIFPQNTILYPNQYLVLVSDSVKFNSLYSISNVQGNILFNLDSTDELNIYHVNGVLMHTMIYSNNSPWPIKPNGLGYTLEFNDTAADQSLASNWSEGCFGGSPGTGIQPCTSPLLVTEINYQGHPKANAGDWLELMNRSTKSMNMKGWTIKRKSNNTSYTIQNNMVLNPSERLVLASDSLKFVNIYTGFNHPIVYGLPSLIGTDELELYNPQGVLMSTQVYDSSASWPAANGTAYTLERIDTTPVANNPTDWFTVCPGGSPGTAYMNCATNLSISEINYHSDGQVNSGDWIELKNNSTIPASIAGFRFINSDSLQVYAISKTDLLFKDERYVLAESLVDYSKINGTNQVEGPTNIDLKDSNETIKIYNNQNELVTLVHYNHVGNWPILAKGKGRTLEYMSGNASDAASWQDGCIGGSPTQAFVPCMYPLVFSEVNYESSVSMNTGDWVELHNTTTQNTVLDGYTLKSNTAKYTFPIGTSISANGYWVVTQNGSAFDQWWNNVSNQSGDLNTGLQSTDELALYDSTGRLVYMFNYSNTSPWPTNVDGTGRTMELADTAKDPFAATNWFAGCYGGTPGSVYSQPCVYNGVKEMTFDSKGLKLYPNPNQGVFTLELPENIQAEQLEIYNMLGEKVYSAKLQNRSQTIDLQHLAKGVYTLRVTEQGKTYQVNWVKE